MDRSPFKTFFRFRTVENSYEDDCKIYYPTPWDREYRAYRRYCQKRIREMALAAYYEDFEHDEEFQDYLQNFPIYAVRSFFCGHEENEISSESYEHLGFVPFDSSDVIKIYDNTTGDVESEHCECSDSQYEGSDVDVTENDSKVRFNLNRVDYGTANCVGFEDSERHCKYCKRRRRSQDAKKAPSLLNLGVFLSNLETKPKILKRRKLKQFQSRQFEHVSRSSRTSIISFVDSNINIEEIITVEDCDCNETPTEDTHTIKMTYSKAIHCKSSKFRLIEKSTSGEMSNQIDTKDTKRRLHYSEVVSGNLSKSRNPRPRDALTIDITQNDNSDKISNKTTKTYSQALYSNLPKLKVIKEKKSKKTVNLSTTRIDSAIDQTATKDVRTCKTYSEVVHSNLPKSRLPKPRSSDKKASLPKTNIENTFDQVATEEKTYKTSYSHIVYRNLPKSSVSKDRSTTDVKSCNTYSKVTYCSVSKSRLIKKTSANKDVGYNASPIDNAFDQPPSDVKTSKTFSQAVSGVVPKSGNDFDQIPAKNIKKPTHKKIKSKMNKTKPNKVPKKDISQAVPNILPEGSLTDEKTSQHKMDSTIPVSPLWSKIVSGVPEKTIPYETESRKINTVTFSKDTVEIEMNPNLPISSTFHIVSGEIHAISPVDDITSTYEIPQMDKSTSGPNCRTWSKIVSGEKVQTASLIHDKISESKCNKNKKNSNTKTKPRVTKQEAPKTNKKKPRFVKLDTRSTSPLEKTVEKPEELNQPDYPWFSYADIIKTRNTEALPVSPPTPQPTNDSNSKEEEWILKEPKHKRSKKNKKM